MRISRSLQWLLVALCMLPTLNGTAATAQATLNNNAIHMNPGKCACGLGLDFYLYFSGFYTEDVNQANGELMQLSATAPANHGSYLLLQDVSMVTSVTVIYLNLPSSTDANGDGRPDFFDPAQGVNTSTAGKYVNGWGSMSPVTASWYRAAGASQGSCSLTLHDPNLGDLGPFHHTFDLIAYSGSADYAPGAGGAPVVLNLARVGEPTTQIQAAIELTRSPGNRTNLLVLANGTWTNSSTGTLEFSGSTLARDPLHPTNYVGTVSATAGDYPSWTLTLIDPNDANHNSIPDLSDDPAPPRRPQLALATTPGRLWITISGDVGHTCWLQEASSLSPTNWDTTQTFSLTNDPQQIQLTLPAGAPKFWRVQTQ